ncbi:nucleotide disphospho-sugar-binding domain-containing protein [Nonomuraea sp. NPDC049709]|uniref:nucleotide disphospho-sugar-binding domain-containing protein n=1 Tax=Nonomuraea sp. NPDC049709 TaxID=3154736 RepID=UPI003443F563
MRILFTMSPGLGHSLSLVPLIWAARSAGHDVLAGTSGHSLHAMGKAGLPAVDGYPGGDIMAVFGEHEQRAAAAGFELTGFLGGLFGDFTDRVVDRFVALADGWGPDLVVHSSLEYAGPIVAAARGVPAVCYHLGLPVPAEIRDAVRAEVRPAAERHGVRSWPVEPAVVLDPMPASLLDPDVELDRPIRFVPYSGGDAARPPWMFHKPERPRVCVTLGTEVPRWAGIGVLEDFVAAAQGLDIELVLALGGADPADLPELPANVRAATWLPIADVIATCSGIVHHGGAATMLTSCAAGVPQLVLPHGGDQYLHAPLLERRGLAAVLDPSEVSVETARDALRRLTGDQRMGRAAEEVRAEMAALPSPADVVPVLEKLA